jgi:hypothetical protein
MSNTDRWALERDPDPRLAVGEDAPGLACWNFAEKAAAKLGRLSSRPIGGLELPETDRCR